MNLYRGMTITGARLRAEGVCDEQAAKVEEMWPEGARLTLANLRRAARAGLDLDWVAERLPAQAQAAAPALAQARAAYDEAMAQAWAAYCEAIAQAWAVYDEARAQALWQVVPRHSRPPRPLGDDRRL